MPTPFSLRRNPPGEPSGDEDLPEDGPEEEGTAEYGAAVATYEEDAGDIYPAQGAGTLGAERSAFDDDDESWLAPDTRRRVKLAIPTFLLGALVLVAGAFWGGAVVYKHFGEHGTTSAASAFAGRAGAEGFGAGAEGARSTGAGGFGGEGAGGFGGFTRQTPAAEGTLSAISGDDLTVTPTSGAKVEVVIGSSTVVTRSGQGASGTLSVGDTVVVVGTKASDGTVTASSVTATAAGVSSTGGGAGGGFAGLSGGSSASGGASRTGTSGGGFSGDGSGVSGGS